MGLKCHYYHFDGKYGGEDDKGFRYGFDCCRHSREYDRGYGCRSCRCDKSQLRSQLCRHNPL